jgi:ABC-type multidrug transport system ATPase subunit
MLIYPHHIHVRHAIGYVVQQSGVDVKATGRKNLMLPGQLYGLTGQTLPKRVGCLLEGFGLCKAADRLASRLAIVDRGQVKA